MRRFFRSDDFSDLESELRDGRPEPRAELLHELVARVEHRPVRTPVRRPRVAAALVFAVVVLLGLASFGGIGYAKSSLVSAAKSSKNVVTSVVKKGDGKQGEAAKNRNQNQNGKSQGAGEQNGNKGTDADDDGSADQRFDGQSSHGNPPWVHQYSRFVLVCYPFTVQIGNRTLRFRFTIVVPRASVSNYVPPGTLGPCRFGPF